MWIHKFPEFDPEVRRLLKLEDFNFVSHSETEDGQLIAYTRERGIFYDRIVLSLTNGLSGTINIANFNGAVCSPEVTKILLEAGLGEQTFFNPKAFSGDRVLVSKHPKIDFQEDTLIKIRNIPLISKNGADNKNIEKAILMCRQYTENVLIPFFNLISSYDIIHSEIIKQINELQIPFYLSTALPSIKKLIVIGLCSTENYYEYKSFYLKKLEQDSLRIDINSSIRKILTQRLTLCKSVCEILERDYVAT